MESYSVEAATLNYFVCISALPIGMNQNLYKNLIRHQSRLPSPRNGIICYLLKRLLLTFSGQPTFSGCGNNGCPVSETKVEIASCCCNVTKPLREEAEVDGWVYKVSDFDTRDHGLHLDSYQQSVLVLLTMAGLYQVVITNT